MVFGLFENPTGKFLHEFADVERKIGLKNIRQRDPEWLLKQLKRCKELLGVHYRYLREKKFGQGNNDEVDKIAERIFALDLVKAKLREAIATP